MKRIFLPTHVGLCLAVMGNPCHSENAMKVDSKTKASHQPSKSHPSGTTQNADPSQSFEIHVHDVGLPHKIWFLPSQKDIVCVQMMFKDAGRKNLTTTHPSLPSFLPTLVSRGAGPYNAQQIREKVYDSGAKIQFSFGQEHAYMSLWAPAPSFKEALRLGVLMATQPKLPSKDLEQRRKSLLISFEESLKSPETHLDEAWNTTFYAPGHPYRVLLEDVKKDIQALQSKDILHYLGLWGQDNAVVVVLGPRAQEEDIIQALHQALLKLPAKSSSEIQTNWSAQPQLDKDNVHVEFPVPQSIVAARIPGFDDQDPDFCVKKLLFDIVCGPSMHSCLYQEIREKLGLAYYCHGLFMTDPHDPHIQILLGTQGSSLERAKQALREILDKIGREGIPQEQFNNMKQEVLGRQVAYIDSTSRLVHHILGQRSRGWSLQKVQSYMSGLSQVTYQQVNEFAKKHFKNIKMCCIDVGQSAEQPQDSRRSS